MKTCECCYESIELKYGSGRFCSPKCARSFSTSLKRKEINEKVRKTLISACRKTVHDLVCNLCNEPFQISGKKKAKQKYCSRSCSAKATNNDPLRKAAAAERMRIRNEKGEFFQSFGRRTTFKNEQFEIRCDSLIEWCALVDLFEKNLDQIKDVKRSSAKIPYTDNEGKKRIYTPDFEVLMKDGTSRVYECKSDQFGTTDIWIRYHKESEIKKEALFQYCEIQGFKPVWFTQKSRNDLYRKAKKNK